MKNSTNMVKMPQRKIINWLLLVLLVMAVPACSPLPHYALPQSQISSGRITGEVIRYRQLAINDFKAVAPPEHIAEYSAEINAHTALVLKLTDQSKIVVEGLPENSFGVKFRVYAQDLGFEVLMVPERSWWNPSVSKKQTSYVLQHEQIHFALMELAARELNREIASEASSFMILTNSPNEERKQLTDRIDQLLRKANEEALHQHQAFDEDTSGLVDQRAQNRWYEKVTQELAQLAP